jgi:hypothetical protein
LKKRVTPLRAFTANSGKSPVTYRKNIMKIRRYFVKILAQLPLNELREELNTALYETRAIMVKTGEIKSVGKLSDKQQYSKKMVILIIVTLAGVVLGRLIALANPVIGIIILGFGIVGGVLTAIESLKNARKAKNSLNADLALLLESTVALPNIPIEYCNDVALEYMVGRIDKGVASTWKDCVEQYEQQVHRWTVEENTAEAARYAKSAARSAAWAAVGAWRR